MASDDAQRTALFGWQTRLPRPSRSSWATFVALLALVLFFLREAVFEGRVFYERDLHLQWYGQVESFVRCIAQGSWPLWDPYVSFGQPLLANANNQILYPPTWLNLVLRPWTYYTLFLGAHLVFSGCGVVRLGERFGLSRQGAFLAASLWIASGPFLSLGNAWNHLAAAAWIPWVLLFAEIALTLGGARSVLTWGLSWALQIATGSPDVVVLTALLATACALRRWDWRHWICPSNRRLASSCLAAGTLALALSAGQWFPSLELASRSHRWGLAAAHRTYWSIHPATLLLTAVPVFWNEIPLDEQRRAVLFEAREPFLFSVYLGVPMFALAALGLARPRDPVRWLLSGFALAATLVALGRHAPFYALAVRLLPPLRVLRYPAKALILTAFCLSLLSGGGFDVWRRRGARGRGFLLLGVLLGVSFLGVSLIACLAHFDADTWGPLLLKRLPPGTSYGAVLATATWKLTWVAGLLLVLLGLILVRRLGGKAAEVSALLVGALAASDLAWQHRQLNRTAPREFFRLQPEAVSAIDQRDLSRLYVYDYATTSDRSQRHLKRETPYVAPAVGPGAPIAWAGAFALREYLLPPIGAAWRLYGSYERDNLGIQPIPLAELNTILAYADGTPLQVRLLRLGAVSQVLALHTAGFEGLEPVRVLTAPFLESLRLYRVPRPLPRTYVVGEARIADGDQALKTLVEPGFRPDREILLPSGEPLLAPSGFHGLSRVVQMKPDLVRIEAVSSAPGYVVLVDAFDPGWQARVDGRPTPVLRANIAFRAVPVGAGRHSLDLVYRPKSAMIGLGVSLAALLLVAGVAVRSHP